MNGPGYEMGPNSYLSSQKYTFVTRWDDEEEKASPRGKVGKSAHAASMAA
jgi:hypothetical protein